jgi:hypothetical protein
MKVQKLLIAGVVTVVGLVAQQSFAAPITLPSDKCVTFAEIKAYRQPLYHNNSNWFDQARNITCKYEIPDPTYGDGNVVIVGTCTTESNCDANCGTSTPPNVNALPVKVGTEVTITQQDNWTNELHVVAGLEWGNENSASSLILGAAKGKVEGGWKHGWGGETAVQVKVGKEETITIDPCKWQRRYSYGAYRSGATGNTTISVTAYWDEHCTVHNAWYNNISKSIGAGSSKVTVTYMIGTTCGANLGSGTCNGLTATGLDTCTACPSGNAAVRTLCNFEPNDPPM